MKVRFRALLSSTTVPKALLSAAVICVAVAGVRRHRLGRTQSAVLALPPVLCLAAAAYHYAANLSAESNMCTAWKKISRLAKVKQKLAANRAESSKITIGYEIISAIPSSRHERRGISIFSPNILNDKFYAWCLSITQPTPPSSPIHMSTSFVLWLSSLTRSRPKHSPLNPNAPSFAPKVLQNKNLNILSSERGKKTTKSVTFVPSRSTTRAENVHVLSSERVKRPKACITLQSPEFEYFHSQSLHMTDSYPPLPTARFENLPWFIPPVEPSPLRIVYPTSRRARSLERREAGYPPGPASTPMVPGSRRWRASQRQATGKR